MKNMNSWYTFRSWPFLKSLYMTKINDLKMINLDIVIFRWIISVKDIEIFRYSTKKVQPYSLQTYFFTLKFLKNDLKTWFKLWYRCNLCSRFLRFLEFRLTNALSSSFMFNFDFSFDIFSFDFMLDFFIDFHLKNGFFGEIDAVIMKVIVHGEVEIVLGGIDNFLKLIIFIEFECKIELRDSLIA